MRKFFKLTAAPIEFEDIQAGDLIEVQDPDQLLSYCRIIGVQRSQGERLVTVDNIKVTDQVLGTELAALPEKY